MTLDPKVKGKGKKAGICDGVSLTAALVHICLAKIFVMLILVLKSGHVVGVFL